MIIGIGRGICHVVMLVPQTAVEVYPLLTDWNVIVSFEVGLQEEKPLFVRDKPSSSINYIVH